MFKKINFNYKIKNIFCLIFLIIFFSNCSVIFNNKFKYIDIHTNKPAKIVLDNDTFNTKDNKISLHVLRQNKDLNIEVISDTLTKKVTINYNKNLWGFNNIILPIFLFSSGIYVPNNSTYKSGSNSDVNNLSTLDIISIYTAPILLITGLLSDGFSEKKYSYPDNVYIDLNNKENKYEKYGVINKKNEVYFNFGIDVLNNYSVNPNNNPKNFDYSNFFNGYFGIDYYYKKDYFINGTIIKNLYLNNVDLTLENNNKRAIIANTIFNLSVNKRYKYSSEGIGLSLQNYNFTELLYTNYINKNSVITNSTKQINTSPPLPFTDTNFLQVVVPEKVIKKQAVGFTFNANFQLSDKLHFGFLYNPYFFDLNSKKWLYEYFFSMNLIWKFKLR